MPKLQEKFPDIELRIIGDGPDYDKLQEQIRNLHLEDRVFLLGRKEKQELYQIIAASDIFVLNTGYEGLSHQLLEVMQLDVPLITTSVGGNIELVKDGESGILVGYNSSDEMYQAIVRYFEDQELQKRVVEGARKEIGEKFSYEVFLKKTVEFLRSL
jgi:glycosyltransferase involved in cell wall biosynthesis